MYKTVLITGAGAGIGAETARTLAARGYQIIVADLAADLADGVVTELNASFPLGNGAMHQAASCDVVDAESLQELAAALGGDFGELHGLVNCAGTISRQPAEEFDMARWSMQLNVHLTGAMLMSKTFFPQLRNGKGAIVNLASVGSTFGLPGRAAYATAKSGVVGLTRTLAVEWGKYGIRVNAVAPGYVNTEMVRSGLRTGSLDESLLIGRTPLGRLAEPSEIAKAIAFLISDDAGFVHGEVLKVDGGLTIDGTFGN